MAALAVRGARWAYAGLVGLAIFYFAHRGGFAFHVPACSPSMDRELVVSSARNYAHVILFAIFFLISYGHFAKSRLRGWPPIPVAAYATLAFGALIELAQGTTRTGNCDLRDLIPDVIGLALGIGVVLTWKAARSRGDLVPPVHGD